MVLGKKVIIGHYGVTCEARVNARIVSWKGIIFIVTWVENLQHREKPVVVAAGVPLNPGDKEGPQSSNN